jgi:hypothetical protein
MCHFLILFFPVSCRNKSGNKMDHRSENNLNSLQPSCAIASYGQTIRWSILFSLLLGLAASCVAFCVYARAESRSMACCNTLQQIGLDLRNYHDLHGTFPPAYLCDRTGKPVNSWRTEVVPYFWYNFRPGRDDYAGDEGYDYTEPWDGPKNAKRRYGPDNARVPLDKYRCYEFQCPSAGSEEPAITNYVAVVGTNTMWSGCEPVKKAADGSDNDKILVIEIINSDILWMEPRDLTLEQALDNIQPKKGVGIGSYHKDGIHYVTVGGVVRTLDRNTDRESLRKLLVRE